MNSYWNRKKLKELILYVAEKRKQASIEEIMNILFVIDMNHYGKTGKSITGSAYIKTKNGVKIRGINGVINEMIHEKSISFQ